MSKKTSFQVVSPTNKSVTLAERLIDSDVNEIDSASTISYEDPYIDDTDTANQVHGDIRISSTDPKEGKTKNQGVGEGQNSIEEETVDRKSFFGEIRESITGNIYRTAQNLFSPFQSEGSNRNSPQKKGKRSGKKSKVDLDYKFFKDDEESNPRHMHDKNAQQIEASDSDCSSSDEYDDSSESSFGSEEYSSSLESRNEVLELNIPNNIEGKQSFDIPNMSETKSDHNIVNFPEQEEDYDPIQFGATYISQNQLSKTIDKGQTRMSVIRPRIMMETLNHNTQLIIFITLFLIFLILSLAPILAIYFQAYINLKNQNHCSYEAIYDFQQNIDHETCFASSYSCKTTNLTTHMNHFSWISSFNIPDSNILATNTMIASFNDSCIAEINSDVEKSIPLFYQVEVYGCVSCSISSSSFCSNHNDDQALVDEQLLQAYSLPKSTLKLQNDPSGTTLFIYFQKQEALQNRGSISQYLVNITYSSESNKILTIPYNCLTGYSFRYYRSYETLFQEIC